MAARSSLCGRWRPSARVETDPCAASQLIRPLRRDVDEQKPAVNGRRRLAPAHLGDCRIVALTCRSWLDQEQIITQRI